MRARIYGVCDLGSIHVSEAKDGSDAERSIRRYGLTIFGLILSAYFLVYFHRTSGGAIASEFQSFYCVDEASVAMLASIYMYAYTIMQIPGGILTDRLGPRRTATLFIGILTCGSLICAISAMDGIRDFTLMTIGRILIGIGAAVISVPAMKIQAVWFPRASFATLTGFLLMAGNIGAVCSAYPMAASIGTIGIMGTYLILTAFSVFITMMIWLFARDKPSEKSLPDIYSSDEVDIPVPDALKAVFGSGRRFWPLAIWFFLFYGALMLWQAAFGGLYYEACGVSDEDYAVFLTMVGIGMIIGCPVIGHLSDRVLRTRRGILIVATACLLIIWLLIWFIDGDRALMSDFVLQCAINLLIGVFGCSFLVSYAQVKEFHPVGMAGTVTAALNMFPFMGAALSITLAGFLLNDFTVEGYRAIWLAASAMTFIALVMIVLSRECASDRSR